MGSASSVQEPSSTFLTAYDYEGEDGYEDWDEDGEEEEGGGSPVRQDSHSSSSPASLISVDTQHYNPPPNPFFQDTDFVTTKQRHYELKDKYVAFLHTYVKEAIPESIDRAKFISSLKLRKRGGHDKNHQYDIDPALIADMETRGSVERATAYKRNVINSVKYDVAHKNKALTFRLGVSGNMTLPCATFMDDKAGEYLDSIDYLGVSQKRAMGRSADSVKRELWRERQVRLQLDKPNEDDDVEDSTTVAEFTKHFKLRQKKAISIERRKATYIERYRAFKQRLREKYINYDYE